MLRVLEHAGSKVCVHDQGAHITSWTTADGIERLFLSQRAIYKDGVAIRGGVPIIFPQFAALGPLPKHGFARSLPWALEQQSDSEVRLVLHDSSATHTHWPRAFVARYQVKLEANTLRMQLNIKNVDAQPFQFTAALHTYLRVAEIANVTITGLQGCRYQDTADRGTMKKEQEAEIHFAGEVDRNYFATATPIIVWEDGKPVMHCAAEGFSDTVIWNPGALLASKLNDMEPEGHRRMVCIEAAAIEQPIALAPGESWRGTQLLSVPMP